MLFRLNEHKGIYIFYGVENFVTINFIIILITNFIVELDIFIRGNQIIMTITIVIDIMDYIISVQLQVNR